MELKELLLELTDDERAALASACGHSYGHIYNVGRGYKECSAELASALEYNTRKLGEHRKVNRWDLIPTKWWWLWPELIGVHGAPPVPDAANDPSMFPLISAVA